MLGAEPLNDALSSRRKRQGVTPSVTRAVAHWRQSAFCAGPRCFPIAAKLPVPRGEGSAE